MTKRIALVLALLFGSSNLWAQLNVYIIKVGQGDAIYIELPSGGNALIDGGPGGAHVTAFLKQKGVTKLDNVVLTHPHNDHYVGLQAVFKNFEVKNYYDTKMNNLESSGDEKTRALANAEPGCVTYYPSIGNKLNWDPGVDIQVLNACPSYVESHKNDKINDCSIVLQVRYNGNSMLFMGDAEIPVEDAIMSKFGSSIKSVILKVAHHGARYASSDKFLAVVEPKYAYISVGLHNNFGHPHREALDRLRASGAAVIMTTGGTQSFTIPAPNKGIPFPAGPVINNTAVSADQEFEDMTLTWTPSVPVDLNSYALDQLVYSVAPEDAVK